MQPTTLRVDLTSQATMQALQQAGAIFVPATSGQNVAPLRLPSQSALDCALQTVVTTYHTTLPTAHIKVPHSLCLT